MISSGIDISDDRQSFFQESLEIIGAKYEKKMYEKNGFSLNSEQKYILDSQDEMPLDKYIPAEDFIKNLRKEYFFLYCTKF